MSAVRQAADEATVLPLETATYTDLTDAPKVDSSLGRDSTTLVVVQAFAADGTNGLGWTCARRACQTLVDDQLTGTVLGRLLGQLHEQVPVYGNGGFSSYDDALHVDANGGYSPAQVVRLGQQLAEQYVTWFEEPLSGDDRAGPSRIPGQLRPDVTRREYGYDLTYFARVCAPGAPALHALRRRAEPATHGVLPRPGPDRAPAGRRSPAGARRRPDAGRPGLGVELRRGRRAVRGVLTAGRGDA